MTLLKITLFQTMSTGFGDMFSIRLQSTIIEPMDIL